MSHVTTQTSYSWQRTARAYRRAVSKADFKETHLRILEKIIFYSADLERHKAIFTRQSDIALICKLDEGEVSKALDELEDWKVIERETVTVWKRARWLTVALLPPPWMTVKDRITEDRNFQEVERFLETIELSADDLLPPDTSFADARRQQFVESRVESSRHEVETPSSQVSPDPDEGAGGPSGLPASHSPVGKSPTRPVVENPSRPEPVGKSPTPSTRDRDREVPRDSGPGSQSRERVLGLESNAPKRPDAAALDYRAYVHDYLFETIGIHEKTGRCAVLWEDAIREIPEKLDELIGHGRMSGVGNIGGWLNRSTYRALQKIREERRKAVPK